MKLSYFPGLGDAPNFLSTVNVTVTALAEISPTRAATQANQQAVLQCPEDCDPGTVSEAWPVIDERGQAGVAFFVAGSCHFAYFLNLLGYWSQDVLERIEEDVERIGDDLESADTAAYTAKVKKMLELYKLQPR